MSVGAHELDVRDRKGVREAGRNLATAWRRFAEAPRRPAPPWLRLGRLGPAELVTSAVSAVLAAALFLDAPLLHWARGLDPALVAGFERLTHLGTAGWILLPLGLAALALAARNGPDLAHRRRAVLAAWTGLLTYVVVVVAGSGLIATLAKRLIGRARPLHFDALGAFDFSPLGDASFASFPSGHATTIFALAAAVALVAPKLRWPVFALASWVALSRAAIGAHYASDAIAGALFALGFALWARSVFARRGLVFVADLRGRYGLRAPALLAEGRRIVAEALRSGVIRRVSGGARC